MEAPWYIYLAECADGALYCGITTDPERRMKAHNGEIAGGAKYTRSRRPVRMTVCVPMPNHREAASLEARLRRLPPAVKLARLQSLAYAEYMPPAAGGNDSPQTPSILENIAMQCFPEMGVQGHHVPAGGAEGAAPPQKSILRIAEGASCPLTLQQASRA